MTTKMMGLSPSQYRKLVAGYHRRVLVRDEKHRRKWALVNRCGRLFYLVWQRNAAGTDCYQLVFTDRRIEIARVS